MLKQTKTKPTHQEQKTTLGYEFSPSTISQGVGKEAGSLCFTCPALPIEPSGGKAHCSFLLVVIKGSQRGNLEAGAGADQGGVCLLACFCLAHLLFIQLRATCPRMPPPTGDSAGEERLSSVSEGDNSITILLFLDMSIYVKLTGINQLINSFCIDYKNQCLDNKP